MCDMSLRLPQYFYLVMEKSRGRYFQVCSPYYQAAQCNRKVPTITSSRCQAKSEKVKKKKSININHCYHEPYLPKSVSTDLLIQTQF